MVTITLYTRQQKRHWCIEQSFGLCGRGTGWDDLGEWHWNMYNMIYETSCQSRFDARYWMLGAGALGRPRGMVWGGRWEEGSGWGTHVYLWWIHFDIWQNQYNIVKLNKKKKTCIRKFKRKSNEIRNGILLQYSCLENSMDREASRSTIHGITKSWTWLRDWACAHTCVHTHTLYLRQRMLVMFRLKAWFWMGIVLTAFGAIRI